MDILSRFIAAERHRYDGEDGNLLALSAGQAARYYEFISIVTERHRRVSREWTSNLKRFRSMSSPAPRPMSNEEMALWEENRRLSTLIHLEIESFYIFAKILLDKIALFIEYYFGQGHKSSLASHDRFTKNHQRFRQDKGLVYPDGLSETLALLKGQICDYRDKQISHLRNLRAVPLILFNIHDDEQTRMGAIRLYPNEREIEGAQAESRYLPELMKAIDAHMEQVIEIISLNRDKSRLQVKDLQRKN